MTKSKLIALLFAIFIAWVIYAADTESFPPIIRYVYEFPNGDKAGHLILYGILAFLSALAFPQRKTLGPISLTWSSMVLLVFTTLEEISQMFFPSRTFSLIDLGFSFLGVLLGDWLALFFKKKP
jgi:VanZ family protein